MGEGTAKHGSAPFLLAPLLHQRAWPSNSKRSAAVAPRPQKTCTRMLQSTSSSREVEIRVPTFFFFAYFWGTLSQKRVNGHYWGTVVGTGRAKRNLSFGAGFLASQGTNMGISSLGSPKKQKADKRWFTCICLSPLKKTTPNKKQYNSDRFPLQPAVFYISFQHMEVQLTVIPSHPGEPERATARWRSAQAPDRWVEPLWAWVYPSRQAAYVRTRKPPMFVENGWDLICCSLGHVGLCLKYTSLSLLSMTSCVLVPHSTSFGPTRPLKTRHPQKASKGAFEEDSLGS